MFVTKTLSGVFFQCGQPMERSRCRACGAAIGGTQHRPLRGNVVVKRLGYNWSYSNAVKCITNTRHLAVDFFILCPHLPHTRYYIAK